MTKCYFLLSFLAVFSYGEDLNSIRVGHSYIDPSAELISIRMSAEIMIDEAIVDEAEMLKKIGNPENARLDQKFYLVFDCENGRRTMGAFISALTLLDKVDGHFQVSLSAKSAVDKSEVLAAIKSCKRVTEPFQISISPKGEVKLGESISISLSDLRERLEKKNLSASLAISVSRDFLVKKDGGNNLVEIIGLLNQVDRYGKRLYLYKFYLN